jgi:outer membrane protein assembly factor BamE
MVLLATAALAASGCVYRMNIQQGNYLVAESVGQLKEGMTRSQVRFLLGTPMVPVAFNDERWDYYYFFSGRKYKQPLKRRLTVYFNEDDKVARYENLGVPTQTDLAQIERDFKRAQNEMKKNRKKPGFFKRIFTRDKAAEPTSAPASDAKSEAEKAPDPVPPSQPLPAPAGTPSGPT